MQPKNKFIISCTGFFFCFQAIYNIFIKTFVLMISFNECFSWTINIYSIEYSKYHYHKEKSIQNLILTYHFILQISCQQVIDYDEDLNGGLGESFQPSIKASCTGGYMNIRVDTNVPFEVCDIKIIEQSFENFKHGRLCNQNIRRALLQFQGIIHGPNRTEEGCYSIGKGATKTYLKLDLTKATGTPGSCGVKYNKVFTFSSSFANSYKFVVFLYIVTIISILKIAYRRKESCNCRKSPSKD